jgi:hypothetical protein
MNDAVEGDQPAERAVRQIQRQHRTLAEVDARMLLRGQGYHLFGEIDADHLRAEVVQITRHVPRPAADVGDRSAPAHQFDQATKQRAVERLVRQFVANVLRVGARHPVVAAAHVVRPLTHRLSSAPRCFLLVSHLPRSGIAVPPSAGARFTSAPIGPDFSLDRSS